MNRMSLRAKRSNLKPNDCFSCLQSRRLPRPFGPRNDVGWIRLKKQSQFLQSRCDYNSFMLYTALVDKRINIHERKTAMVMQINKKIRFLAVMMPLVCVCPSLWAVEIAQTAQCSVVELAFDGPLQSPKDVPARDIDFWVLFRHESGPREYKIHGFWDGDGKGGTTGNVFKIRFCPTPPGRWI